MAFDLFSLSKESFNDFKKRFYAKFEKHGKVEKQVSDMVILQKD